jgi:hypothetical protein
MTFEHFKILTLTFIHGIMPKSQFMAKPIRL